MREKRTDSRKKGSKAGCALLLILTALILLSPLILRRIILTDEVSGRISAEVRQRVEDAFGKELEIGRLHIDILGRIVISDIRFGGEPEPIMRAEKAIAIISLRRLITDRDNPGAAIRTVTVVRPRIHIIRHAGGGWNFDSILGSGAGSGAEMLPEFGITIQDADISFDDRHTEAPLPIAQARIPNLHARLDLLREKVLALDASAPETSLGDKLDLKLRFDLTAGWKIDGSIEHVDMKYVERFINPSDYSIAGSVPALSFTIEAAYTHVGNPPNYSWSGRGRLEDAVFSYPSIGIVMKNIKGEAGFTTKTLVVENARGELFGGAADFGFSVFLSDPVRFALDAQVTDINIESLKSLAGETEMEFPAGRADGFVSAQGTFSDPRAVFSVTGRDLAYAGYGADSLEAAGEYGGGVIELRRIEARRGAGTAGGAGTVVIGEEGLKDYRIVASIDNISAPDILDTTGYGNDIEIEGMLSGNITIFAGENGSPGAAGTIRAADAAIMEVDRCEAIASFYYMDDMLAVENFVLTGEEEAVVMRGTVGAGGALDITVDGGHAPVRTVLALAGRDDLEASGSVRFSGVISGTPDAPVLAGSFESESIAVSSFAVDRAEGALSYAANNIELEDISLVSGNDRHHLAGNIDFENRTLAMSVNMDDTSLRNMAQLVHDAMRMEMELPDDLDGRFDAQLLVTGSFDNPAGALSIKARDISVYGEKIDSVTMSLDYSDILTVREGSQIRVAGTDISVSGTASERKIDLRIEAPGIRIQEIEYLEPYSVSGLLQASVSIGGSFKSPVVSATAYSEELTFRDTAFKLDNTEMHYENQFLTAKRIPIIRSDEKYIFRFVYDTAVSSMDIAGDLDNAAMKTFVGFLPYEIPEGTGGVLDGSFRLYHESEEVSGAVKLEGKDLSLGTYPIDELVLDGSFEGDTLEINKFEAFNDASIVTADGTLDMREKAAVRMNINARGIELARFSEMGLIGGDIEGFVDVIIDMVTEDGEQLALGSFDAYDPGVAGVTFERGRGRFEFNGRVIELRDVKFLHGDDRISVEADIPVSDENAGSFRIEPSGEDIDLSLLNPALERLGLALAGTASLDNVVVNGSFERPELHGRIIFSGGGAEYNQLEQPVENINGSVLLSGNEIILDGLSATFSGSEARISGGAVLDGLALKSFRASVSDMQNVRLAYGAIYDGMVDVKNLGVRGSADDMSFYSPAAGAPVVAFHHGTFTLPQMTTQEQEKSSGEGGGLRSLNFGEKEFTVRVGDGMTVRTAGDNMKLSPHGELQLSGSLGGPEVSGWLVSTRGYVRAFANTFKMIDDTYIGFYTLPGVGIIPIFYARARTRAGGTEITMEISGPMVDMDLVPAYRDICGETEEIGGAAGIGVPTMALGSQGEMIVPICPRVDFTAYAENDPAAAALSDQEIMQKLTHTEAFMQGEQQISKSLGVEALDIFSPYVGSIVESKAGLENFAINLDPNRDLLVELEKRILDKFYIKYNRTFSRIIEEELEVRYKFQNRSFLKWGIDQDSQTDYQVEYRLRF